MISGKIVYLSSIERQDLPLILNWRNNQSLRRYFREHTELSLEDQEAWYMKIIKNDREYFWSIHDTDSNEILGVCGVNYIDWIDRKCQLSLYIGKDGVYIDDSGQAEEAARLVLDYSFNVLNLHKVYVEVYEFDKKKRGLLENIGFLKEGELKEHSFKNGKYFSSYIYSIFSKGRK